MQHEHLSYSTIQRYRMSQLSPIELLDFDDHLSICEKCRHNTLQENDLTELYDSLIISNKPKKSFFSDFWQFNFNRQLQFAAILLGFFSLAAMLVYFFTQNQLPQKNIVNKADENPVQNLPVNAPEVIANRTSNVAEPQQISEKAALSTNTKKKRSVQIINTPNVNFTERTSTISRQIASNNKPLKEIYSLNIAELETDKSQTLGSEPANTNSTAAKVKVSNAGKKFGIVIDNDEKAEDYEFYLAEMSKLAPVSKAKVKTNKWHIQQNKLKKNKKYVLQITLHKKDGQIETVRKVLSLIKLSPNKTKR